VGRARTDHRLVEDQERPPACHSCPALAADLIESTTPNEFGWYFPSAKDPSKPVSAGTLYSFMWRQRGRGIIPIVTNRDLRRTWKTLAGQAGISKEIRDRIQNHALHDVSSKN
jgi:integrase